MICEFFVLLEIDKRLREESERREKIIGGINKIFKE